MDIVVGKEVQVTRGPLAGKRGTVIKIYESGGVLLRVPGDVYRDGGVSHSNVLITLRDLEEPVKQAPRHRLFDLARVAREYLCCRATIMRRVRLGVFCPPSFKVGKYPYWTEGDLREWERSNSSNKQARD